MRKLTFLAGALAGYVLGARAGQKRYEQIKKVSGKVWHSGPVQKQVESAKDAARTKAAPALADAVAGAARSRPNASGSRTVAPESVAPRRFPHRDHGPGADPARPWADPDRTPAEPPGLPRPGRPSRQRCRARPLPPAGRDRPSPTTTSGPSPPVRAAPSRFQEQSHGHRDTAPAVADISGHGGRSGRSGAPPTPPAGISELPGAPPH